MPNNTGHFSCKSKEKNAPREGVKPSGICDLELPSLKMILKFKDFQKLERTRHIKEDQILDLKIDRLSLREPQFTS